MQQEYEIDMLFYLFDRKKQIQALEVMSKTVKQVKDRASLI